MLCDQLVAITCCVVCDELHRPSNPYLHSAAVQGQAEVIRALVAAGADTDLKVCHGGKEGVSHDASPLLLATLGGHLEAARVLLEGG